MAHFEETCVGNAALAASRAILEELAGTRLNAELIAGKVFDEALKQGRAEYIRVYGKPSSYPLAAVGHDAQGED